MKRVTDAKVIKEQCAGEIMPMFWIDHGRTIFPKVCKATGERIGWFEKAYRWTEEVEYRGEVYTNNVYWYSKAGYAWLVLQGKV